MVAEPERRDEDHGTASWFLDSLVTTRIRGAETEGAFAMLEHVLPPEYETPYHRHHNEDEFSYILEGELTLVTEQGRFTATPGQTTVAPRGRPHGFRITSDGPTRRLVMVSPAGFEEFFHDVGTPAESRTLPEPSEPDMERLGEIAAEYDIEILGPLPAPSD